MIEIAPGIRRIRAPNPSPMTQHGTNGYIVGTGVVAVVDPGPDDPRHLAAWRKALAQNEVALILVTHAHLDHSGLARRLSDLVRAPVAGFGPPEAGRSAIMQRLAVRGGIAGGEGVDRGFAPDRTLADGERIEVASTSVEVIHTPGHFAGHLCFGVGDALFSGDHVMGWASTLISPPDGDVDQFLASCVRLAKRNYAVYLPGHGDPVLDPATRVAELAAHRKAREAAIVEALAAGHTSIGEIVERIYSDTPVELGQAAARNVFAHLVALAGRGAVEPQPEVAPDATWHLRVRPPN